MSLRRFLTVGALSLAALSCGAADKSKGSQTALDNSALGRRKCQTEGDEHKLFLVEWDATDLSSFEAKANRDLVFVHYENCQVRVLSGCSDDGIAGRYGSYRKPELTSGNLEGLSIKSEDELYAKLPLGAATFGGELARGRALDLKYFVSGSALSTRDTIYRADLQDNPRCADATHFVAAYSLGAFTLSSVDASRVGAGASVGGLGAGAKHTEETNALKRAGDLQSCSGFDQHACKAPIRVTLRALSAGTRAASAASGAAAPVDTQGTVAAVTNSMQGVQLRASAAQKLQAGDAAGCLQDLDRANNLERSTGNTETDLLRAQCEMRSGKCAEGKKHYREAKAAWSRKHDATGLTNDATLDAEAEQAARQYCPSQVGGGTSPFLGALGLVQKILQARGAKDTAGCLRHGAELEKIVAAAAPSDPDVKQSSAGLRVAAECVAEAGKCAEAKRFWTSFSKAFFGGSQDNALIESSFKENIKACAKR